MSALAFVRSRILGRVDLYSGLPFPSSIALKLQGNTMHSNAMMGTGRRVVRTDKLLILIPSRISLPFSILKLRTKPLALEEYASVVLEPKFITGRFKVFLEVLAGIPHGDPESNESGRMFALCVIFDAHTLLDIATFDSVDLRKNPFLQLFSVSFLELRQFEVYTASSYCFQLEGHSPKLLFRDILLRCDILNVRDSNALGLPNNIADLIMEQSAFKLDFHRASSE